MVAMSQRAPPGHETKRPMECLWGLHDHRVVEWEMKFCESLFFFLDFMVYVGLSNEGCAQNCWVFHVCRLTRALHGSKAQGKQKCPEDNLEATQGK